MGNVTLTAYELSVAGQVGFRRNLEATLKGRKPRFKETRSGELFGFHILSAMAELAVSKYFGKYWSFHENKFSSGDVGNMEIRYSQRMDLKVRDRDEGVIVSVSGSIPTFIMNGWIDAQEAKQERWLKAPIPEAPPAYFVPINELNDIDTLLTVIG